MKYKGMTVNERLYISGLMDVFDEAVKKGDRKKVKKILKSIELDEGSISEILEKLNLKEE
jgi:hypothetical protein